MTAPMVAPISGMMSVIVTISARASGYGMPSALTQTSVATPAISATTTAPATYPPTRPRTSSLIRLNRARRVRGTSRYAVRLIALNEDRK